MTRSRTARLALPALIGGAVGIAFAPIFVRLSQVGPTATAFWRLALALPLLWLWTSLRNRYEQRLRKPATKSDYALLIAAGLFFAGDLGIWHWSIHYTSVANATLLVNFMPILVTIGAWLLLDQRVSRLFLVGLGAAMLGATLIIGASFSLSLQNIRGDLLALLAALFYASYILTVTQLRRDFSTATILIWAGIVACGVLLPLSLVSGEDFMPYDVRGWLVLIALALVSHIGGQGLIAFALAHLPAAFSSVSLLLQPVLATLFAWLLLGELLSPSQALGGLLVLLGILIARRESRAN
jgi:drug/metabolite transporter (DMT)-like permease